MHQPKSLKLILVMGLYFFTHEIALHEPCWITKKKHSKKYLKDMKEKEKAKVRIARNVKVGKFSSIE
jgi:hypothetical protein